MFPLYLIHFLTALVSIWIALMLAFPAWSLEPDVILQKCQISPEIYSPVDPPEFFPKSNNLRRKEGAAEVAQGTATKIVGVILDKNCTPIQDVKINVWQTNHFGHYQEYYARDEDDSTHDPHFAGAGTAITNNLGEFVFYTIMPQPYKDRAAQIHLKAYHHSFGNFETILYFPYNPANMSDPQYLALTPEKRQLAVSRHYQDKKAGIFQNNVYFLPITLPTDVSYRGF